MSYIFESSKRSDDISDEINKYLKYFGLFNFDIKKDWRKQYDLLINTKNMLPNMTFKNNTYDYTETTDTIIYSKYFKYIANHARGTYNNIIKCEDGLDNIIIFRISMNHYEEDDPDFYNEQYELFIENLKTIVLYIYSKCYLPIKIMPDIYGFAYDYTNKQYYLMMEYIENTLNDYIIRKIKNIDIINSMICKIYKILELLNEFGLKFKHGDLKSNNVLINSDDNPLLIDFGFTSFVIPKSTICIEKIQINSYYLLNYHDKYPEIDPIISNKLNSVHDLILLIHSMQYIPVVTPSIYCNIMNSKNDEKCIIDVIQLDKYINKFFNINSRSESFEKNIQFKLYFDKHSNIDMYRDIQNGFIDRKIKIYMSYDELIEYVGLKK